MHQLIICFFLIKWLIDKNQPFSKRRRVKQACYYNFQRDDKEIRQVMMNIFAPAFGQNMF